MGATLVEELAEISPPKCVLSTAALEKHPDAFLVSEALIKKITQLPSPEGIVAEFPLPKPSSLANKRRLLCVDRLADPGNLGTLLRSALAFGFEGIFLIEPSVDLFNDKTIRASRGACFLLPFCYGSVHELKALIDENALTPLIADLEGENFEKVGPLSAPLLILGNESHGPSEEVKNLGKKITIPLSTTVESLNVAIAGSILLYALSR